MEIFSTIYVVAMKSRFFRWQDEVYRTWRESGESDEALDALVDKQLNDTDRLLVNRAAEVFSTSTSMSAMERFAETDEFLFNADEAAALVAGWMANGRLPARLAACWKSRGRSGRNAEEKERFKRATANRVSDERRGRNSFPRTILFWGD